MDHRRDRDRSLSGRGFFAFTAGGLVITALCLAGCVDSFASAPVAQEAASPGPNNMVRREGVSPSGVTVAVASLAGGPDAMRARFATAFDSAAKAQAIIMATPGAADYLVRGYLNAVPEGQGTAVTYVLDIFDGKKHRIQRVEDKIMVQARSEDAWSVVDDSALSAVAAKSAAALAAVLTNTPEAILAATKVQAAAAPPTIAARDDGRSIVAATPPVGPPENGATLHQ